MTMAPQPLLRTLVPALRGLGRELGDWLRATNRRYPISTLVGANLEGMCDDLRRRADDLELDQPLLVVVLMGGTGVGKSTLLNALAGAEIAQAAVIRPTTRNPVVYHHRAIKLERLDPALRACRLVGHDREELREKILVDTPDLDSNEELNRVRLLNVLPVADVVLYVGSQEKYHDRVGWELFRAQRQRRAFAFVLNKWDRCTQATNGGLRPDEDLLRDLAAEGFQNPLIFRTAAQHWIDKATGISPTPLPDGEQFADLVSWLAAGLSRLEIESLKARGIEQLLADLQTNLTAAEPPDVSGFVSSTREEWHELLDREATELSNSLIHTLEPHQREIELHFRLTGQQRFQRLMAGYLGLLNKLQFATKRISSPIGSLASGEKDSSQRWDQAGLTRDVMLTATQRGLEQRVQALGDRLLVAAGTKGFPSEMLALRLHDVNRLDWRGQLGAAVSDSLGTVERQWAEPTGSRKLIRGGLVLLANIVPELTFVTAVIVILWKAIMEKEQTLSLGTVFVPFVLTLAVLMVFHILIHLLLPLRWPAIRSDFRRNLDREVLDKLRTAYLDLPNQVATDLASERSRIQKLGHQVAELKEQLIDRRQNARIDSLYGHAPNGTN